ncbi:MAG: protein phosphatase 2C domain-containing protein [Hyphomonadaceae bacterium]|nr:protein phosphatase 2C domain-containing protein [Hyphomonadaceae bacterium]
MAAFDIIEAVNSPGTPGKTGDDRYGFDAGEGTAWVLDGATDATPLQPFPGVESGAAWFAETLSDALLANAHKAGETAEVYLQRVLATVRQRAEDESETSLESLPPEAWPIASGIWLRRLDEHIELCWLGDCMALDLATGTVIGTENASEKESAENREILKRSETEIWDAVRQARRQTFETRKPIFSLRPEVAAPLNTAHLPVESTTQLVLMSDGFYRLIHPYGLHDGPALAEAIRTHGLGALITQLRDHEARHSREDMARIKRADDACALWLAFT